jgi:hypothetical protein
VYLVSVFWSRGFYRYYPLYTCIFYYTYILNRDMCSTLRNVTTSGTDCSVLFVFGIQPDLLIHVECVRGAVAQLVEALLYKPKGRGFDSRWCHWNFSLT